MTQTTTRNAILFLVFNRPAVTRQVFDAIRKAAPPRLYVAADGPRASREGEANRCRETREIATAVDWNCEVKTLFRDRNLGCKQAVAQAVDWFFQNEEQGIILEDDILPHLSFFPFCDELLERYRANEEIGLICGGNFQFGRTYGDASYYFSRYVHIWGWASWRRAWRHYDRDITQWPSFRDAGGLAHVEGMTSSEKAHWRRVYDKLYAGKIDTWDYQWNLAQWLHGMRSIIPQKNLISNLGFGADATHTHDVNNFANMTVEGMDFPLRHPAALERNMAADDYTAQTMFAPTLQKRVVNKLRVLARRLMGKRKSPSAQPLRG